MRTKSTIHHQWPNFWFKRNLLSFSLLPLSFLVILLSNVYKFFVKVKTKNQPPIVVVGNLVFGGTGKTPMLIWLAEQLMAKDIKFAIVSKGYGAKLLQRQNVVEVSKTHTALEVGDEPAMLKTLLPKVVILIANKRMKAIKQIALDPTIDIILSDDGLQHFQMPRNFEIVMADSKIGFANKFVFPAGPLREPMSRLKFIDWQVVTYNQGDTASDIDGINLNKPIANLILKPVVWKNVYSGEEKELTYFNGLSLPLLAIAGIGNPKRFFAICKNLGILASFKAFKDHYEYKNEDFFDWQDHTILMTHKDAVKCDGICPKDSWFLVIKPCIESENANKIIHNIVNLVKI